MDYEERKQMQDELATLIDAATGHGDKPALTGEPLQRANERIAEITVALGTDSPRPVVEMNSPFVETNMRQKASDLRLYADELDEKGKVSAAALVRQQATHIEAGLASAQVEREHAQERDAALAGHGDIVREMAERDRKEKRDAIEAHIAEDRENYITDRTRDPAITREKANQEYTDLHESRERQRTSMGLGL